MPDRGQSRDVPSDLRERIVLAMYPASTGGRGHKEALAMADRILAVVADEFVSRDAAEKLAKSVEYATTPGRTFKHSMRSLPAALRRYREATNPAPPEDES